MPAVIAPALSGVIDQRMSCLLRGWEQWPARWQLEGGTHIPAYKHFAANHSLVPFDLMKFWLGVVASNALAMLARSRPGQGAMRVIHGAVGTREPVIAETRMQDSQAVLEKFVRLSRICIKSNFSNFES